MMFLTSVVWASDCWGMNKSEARAKKQRSFMWCEERWHQKGSTGWKLGILKEGRKEQEGETGSGSLFCCYHHTTPLPTLHSCCKLLCPLLVNISLFELKRHLGLRREGRKSLKSFSIFSTFWKLWKLEILTFLLVPWDDCSIHASFQRSKVFGDCEKPAVAKMRMCKQSGTVEEAQYVGVWKCRGVWEYVYSM